MGIAGIYVRISLDLQDGAGIQRQETECRELAAREGLAVAEVYADNSISAHSGKTRPAFERLLADLEAGKIDTIVVWAIDRLYRRLADLERLVDALGDTPVHAVRSGRINLGSADGRMQARILGAVAQHEGEKKGERVAAAARQRATAGRSTTSSRPFGWRRIEGGLEPDPAEGPAVAAAYQQLLDGETLSGIARWLDSQGFVGTRGGRWTQSNVSALLRQPRHGGLVGYKGAIMAAPNGEGALVDEVTWRQAQRILSGPGRRRRPGRPANALLSGFLRCYKCGETVRASSNQLRSGQRYKTYACASNHVSWRREHLDDLITGEVEAMLIAVAGQLAEAAAEAANATVDGNDTAAAEVARLEQDRQDLADALAAGKLRASAYAVAVESVEQALAVARDQMTPPNPTAADPVMADADPVDAFRTANLTAGVQSSGS